MRVSELRPTLQTANKEERRLVALRRGSASLFCTLSALNSHGSHFVAQGDETSPLLDYTLRRSTSGRKIVRIPIRGR